MDLNKKNMKNIMLLIVFAVFILRRSTADRKCGGRIFLCG